MHLMLALIGALIGSLVDGDAGWLFGGGLGFVTAWLWTQQQTIRKLDARLVALTEGVAATETSPSPVQAAASPAEREAQPAAEAAAVTLTQPAPDAATTPPTPSGPRPAQPTSQSTASARRTPPTSPTALERRFAELLSAVTRLVTTGNPVVRVGAVVLFIGVAFLLRYAYEHALVPVELRLAGAALGGIVLLVIGWRLRERSDTYGLILQGAGVAILYLTVFAAARLYGLLPMGGAFAILVVLVAGASVLAVAQQSQALAILSMSGGFLAPVLTSTGEGSHVALFSYYALLNAGILGMAWFRRWRWLNWVGFVFTFVIGASWGYEYYRPEHFASTEPFLILFFAFYLGVSVLFARREPVALKGVIDGTLVFGTPVIAFALQAALVRDMSFGLAFSALGAALVYMALALWLKRQGKVAGLLDTSFVALAVVFATLAIPFAFDNQRFTAATWALEGAGIYWVGIRQAQRLPRAFGALLQLLAGFVFATEIGRPVGGTLFLNSAYLGTAFLGLAGGFSAWLMSINRADLHRLEYLLRWPLLVWASIWWLSGGLRELAWQTPGEARFAATNIGEHLFLIYVATSVAALTLIARRARWREGLIPGLSLLPIAVGVLLALDLDWRRDLLLRDFGWIAWPAVLGVFYWHLKQSDELGRMATLWHAAGWWFVTLLLTYNVAAAAHVLLGDSVWTNVLWGAVPLAGVTLMRELRTRQSWPFQRHAEAYFGRGWLVGFIYLIGWLLVTSLAAGDPRPLPYLVLLNPLELTQAAILLLGVFWVRGLSGSSMASLEREITAGLAALGFLWINFVAMRAVHFYGGVPYPVDRILDSDTFQATMSILWTLIALGLMGLGTRRALRIAWIIGATLLGLVILKLFLLDLGKLSLVARIISFITVGVLMLVIGYFAPLPPKERQESSPPAPSDDLEGTTP